MRTTQLVERFIEIGIAQADALDAFDTRKFNRLYDREDEIVNELRARRATSAASC